MKVYLDGQRIALDPSMALGKGGEADVYALPDGRALKIFKPATHPDLAMSPSDQRAATARLALHQRKLPAFPTNLPDRVVVPEALATEARGGSIVGYAMRRIEHATLLYRYAEPLFGQRADPSLTLGFLRDLHLTLSALHHARVVVGDFNDLNVMIARDKAFFIDADSFQFGGFPCTVFTDRFVDPRLCVLDQGAPRLTRPHDESSDWYAFAVMWMRTLLFVGPYGGVHRPPSGAPKIAPAARSLARVTVFSSEVVYPKPARHYRLLPDDLLHYFHEVFEEDRRGPVPAGLLDSFRWTTCARCATQHARAICPTCAAGLSQAARTVVQIRGNTRAITLTKGQAEIRAACEPHQNRAHRFWIYGDTLLRSDRFGPLRIGEVIGARTQFFVGETMGFGFYAAGAMTVGFVFDPERTGLNDQVRLGSFRGTLMQADCAIANERAWFFTVEQIGQKVVARCTAIHRDGTVLGSREEEAAEGSWLRAGASACAVGSYLFVCTDEGIVRAEVAAGVVSVTRTFPDTAPFVDTTSRLYVDERGLFVVHDDNVIQLEMS